MAKATGAKNTAWIAFGHFIRVRDCLATTYYPFVGVCVTCKRRFHITALDAGHMTPGRSNGVLFNEELVNAQCSSWCNRMNHGFHDKYRKVMVEKYGEEQISTWEREGKKPIPDKDMDFPAITQKYRALTKELLRPFSYNSFEDMLHGHQF